MALTYPAPQVVVIDDDPAILSALCELLADEHISAEGCPSGSYALKYILHRRPQVVILDVLMPGVDGVDVFHQLHNDPFMARTTVIFLTGDTVYLRDRFPDYAEHGAVLLTKPFDADTLIAHVKDALDARGGSSSRTRNVVEATHDGNRRGVIALRRLTGREWTADQ